MSSFRNKKQCVLRNNLIRTKEFMSWTAVIIFKDKEETMFEITNGKPCALNKFLSMNLPFFTTQIGFFGDGWAPRSDHVDRYINRNWMHDEFLQYLIICYAEKASSLLWKISSQMKNSRLNIANKKEWLRHLSNFARILTHSGKLALKYIFRSDDPCQLWKPFLHSLVIALVSFIPTIKKCNRNTLIRWNLCFVTLLGSIKYWKYKHFTYTVMDTDLGKFLKICQQRNFHPVSDGNIKNLICPYRSVDCCVLLLNEMKLSMSINLYTKVHSKLRNYVDFDVVRMKNRNMRLVGCWTAIAVKVKCSWPLCNKYRNEFNVKHKCKGCRLVRYCCRNHQKKHWKYIHSTQCLYLSLRTRILRN
eukprot:388638_1